MRKHLMRDWFRNMSIRRKLMLISLGVLIPVSLFLIAVYSYYIDFVYQDVMGNFNFAKQQYIQTIESNIEKRQMVVRTLCNSSSIKDSA